jgi:hypothetical protein
VLFLESNLSMGEQLLQGADKCPGERLVTVGDYIWQVHGDLSTMDSAQGVQQPLLVRSIGRLTHESAIQSIKEHRRRPAIMLRAALRAAVSCR